MFSVSKACEAVGIRSIITSDLKEILKADAAILPGVGAFGDAMKNLTSLDLVGPIKDFIASGRPFFGVCLGLQLLFTESEEFGSFGGLDIIRGTVKRFTSDNNRIKVPQIGWNTITPFEGRSASEWSSSPLHGIDVSRRMYFVHSYYVVPESGQAQLTRTSYGGIEYCSSVYSNNVFATQFHPEKSGKEGIAIYQNWAKRIQ